MSVPRTKVPRPPPPSSALATAVMKANRPRNTGPELALRRSLWAMGLRGYRLTPKGVPGRPDVAFVKARVAVFVHGCFWHRHGCSKAKSELPKANRGYWETKFRLNVERDSRKVQTLESEGWHVLTIWECEIDADVGDCDRRVAETLAASHESESSSALAE